MSGAMGGSASEEFLAPLEVGEDTFVRCTNCDYAANTEAVSVPVPDAAPVRRTLPPAQVVDTPDTPTIQTLVDLSTRTPSSRRPDGAVDGRRHAEERRRQAAPPRRHAPSRWRSACRATATST